MDKATWKPLVGLLLMVVALASVPLADGTRTAGASQLIEPVGQLYGVVVGVSDYLHIDDLRTPDNGARQISHQLSEIWGDRVRLRVLLNKDATRNRIGEAIYWLASLADEDDSVMFYFSGHGDAEGLAPHDALRDSSSNDITATLLDQWLEALASTRVFVVIDSCKAASHARELARPGRVILASCGENSDTRSEMSNLMVKALHQPQKVDRNGNGTISVEELFEDISCRLRSQQPFLFDGCHGDLELASIKPSAS